MEETTLPENPIIAALIALFAWWFFTGAILWVVKRADHDGPSGRIMAVVLGVPFLLAGMWALGVSLSDEGVGGAYLGFAAALMIWGWIEVTFLTGVITGPAALPCPPASSGIDRFLRAWGAVAYHELLLTVALILILYGARGAENMLGVWVFATLYFARISAKLNLFFGVPRINTEFLTEALAHTPSHFRTGPPTAMFALSVTALTLAVACWLERITAATAPGAEVGFALLAAMTALALLEHWFMVLPLPDAKLWRWMIPAPKPKDDRLLREDANGL